jgi:hypothetical protein
LGGKTAQSTQAVTIPPAVLAQYQSVVNSSNQVAQTPFQQYGNPGATNADGTTQQFVAPVNSTQQTGIAGTTAAANEAQPGYTAAQNTLGTAQSGTTGINDAATGLAAASAGQVNATPLTGSDINSYLSPYLGDVLGTTNALANQNNAQAQSGALGTAISSGAFGSDRTGIAAANLNQQQGLAEQATDANILNTGYNTALGTAQQQQGVNLSAGQANRAALASSGSELASIGQTAYGEGANTASEQGALASGAQTAGLQGANAEIAAGTVQQQTQQAQDTAEYNQFLQQQSFPFQVQSWLAGISEGTGALSGSTTTTQQPGGFFSDRRLKHDIKKIGETFDKQTIYSYKMHGDDRTHIGLMAQSVEKKHPEAVGLARGYKIVDYGAATEDAANRGHFFEGGVVPMRRAKAGGGPSIVDAGDLQAILAAQQGMYAPMAQASGVYGGAGGSVPRGGSSRVPAPEGAVPHLVTAQGSLKQQPTGVQNLASAANLYKEGKGIYDDTQKPVRHTTTTTTPGGVAPSATGAWSDPGANFDGSAANVAPDTTEASVSYRRGGVAGARRGYDDGGGVDFDSLAAAHGAMYGQGSARPGEDIPSGGGGSHQLAVASGSPQAAPSGASNLNQGLGLAQKGYQAYKHFNTPSSSPASPPQTNGPWGSDAVGSVDGSTPVDMSGGFDGSAGVAAAPAAPAAAPAATSGLGSAGAADVAGSAAGAAGEGAADAAVAGGADAAAAAAAEALAADAAVAVIAAKRGGKIKRGKFDAGGMPYSSDDGSLDIPDTSSGASALKTAGPLQKQPTGLQTLETLGTEQGAQGAISGMFSNQALKRGGVAGARRGYATDGSVDDDTDNTDAGPSTAAPVADAPSGVAAAAKPDKLSVDSGPSWWDKNKGKAIPLLEGLAAMGTAPTKHLGVALAAGLGAGAGAYVPVNAGLADTRQTEATTQGVNLANQIAQQKLNYMKTPAPTPAAPTQAAQKPTGITPLSVDDATGYYQDKYKFNPNITPQAAANIARLKNVDAVAHTNLSGGAQLQAENDVKQGEFTAQNAAQRDYDKLNLGVVHAGDNGDSAYTNLKQINPGLAAQVAVKAGLDPANQDSWKPDEIKNADKFAAQAAAQHMALIHQYTGSDYEGGNAVDKRTNVPAPGPATAQLTPEGRSGRQIALAQPTIYGGGLPTPLGQAAGISQTPPGPAGSSPAAAPSPARTPARTPPRSPVSPAPPAAPQDPVLAQALADPKYKAAPIPTPVDQVGLQNAKDLQKARTETATNLQQDAEQASQNAGSALQFAQAAKNIMDSKGAPTVGLTGNIAKTISSVFGGVDATNYQEVAKYLGNLAVQSGKGNFPHATEKENMVQFNDLSPSVKQTGDALNDLLSTNIRNLQYTLDTANRTTDYLDPKYNNDPQKFFRWNQNHYPRADAVNPPPEAPETGKSKSGRDIVKINGRWEYKP